MKRFFTCMFSITMAFCICGCQGVALLNDTEEKTEMIENTPKISEEERKEAIYQEAMELMEKCEFLTAKSKFEEIQGYRDSNLYVERCSTFHKEKEYYIKAIKKLKGQLKNPASLQVHGVTFGQPWPTLISKESEKQFVGITIDYSAQNGFGGMNREKYRDAFYSGEENCWEKYQNVNGWYYLQHYDVSSISY